MPIMRESSVRIDDTYVEIHSDKNSSPIRQFLTPRKIEKIIFGSLVALGGIAIGLITYFKFIH